MQSGLTKLLGRRPVWQRGGGSTRPDGHSEQSRTPVVDAIPGHPGRWVALDMLSTVAVVLFLFGVTGYAIFRPIAVAEDNLDTLFAEVWDDRTDTDTAPLPLLDMMQAARQDERARAATPQPATPPSEPDAGMPDAAGATGSGPAPAAGPPDRYPPTVPPGVLSVGPLASPLPLAPAGASSGPAGSPTPATGAPAAAPDTANQAGSPGPQGPGPGAAVAGPGPESGAGNGNGNGGSQTRPAPNLARPAGPPADVAPPAVPGQPVPVPPVPPAAPVPPALPVAPVPPELPVIPPDLTGVPPGPPVAPGVGTEPPAMIDPVFDLPDESDGDAAPTSTPTPVPAATRTPKATAQPTGTAVPPTGTPAPPTAAPTGTPAAPATPTGTLAPPTATPAAPTATPALPTSTHTPAVTPTATSTSVPAPPTSTSTPTSTPTPTTGHVVIRTDAPATGLFMMGNMRPGACVLQTVNVFNAGILPFDTYTLTTSIVDAPTPLWTDPTNGLQLQVRRSGAVIYDGPVAVNGLSLGVGMPPGGSDTLELRVCLPSSAGNVAQGLTQTLTFTWSATGG